MKRIMILAFLLSSYASYSKDYFYRVEDNDQLGVVFLSLGHLKLWPKDGKINQFKKSSQYKIPNKIYAGSILKIADSDIVFLSNINIDKNDFITFKNRIKTVEEFESFARTEHLSKDKIENTPAPRIIESEKSPKQVTLYTHSLNLYPGLGGFVANNREIDREVTTKTFSGLQPLLQVKAIYSTDLFGSLSIDLFTKKIFNNQFSFPVNLDYRIQLVPKWNFTDFFHFALSHSIIKHSYVGKSSTAEIPYELKSNFVGLGLVFPRENFWFELYVEKAYRGESKSPESTQDTSKGWRIDSEAVYPLSQNWRLLPGINYYKIDSKQTEYSFSVVEARMVLSREFEF